MAVFFPVMLCQLIERSVGFLVLAAVKLALELVWLVVFSHVLIEFTVAHLFFAIGDFGTRCSFAFEPSDIQVTKGQLNFFTIFVCCYELLGAGHASIFVIFVEDGSAGAANWIETFRAVFWVIDHVHARTAFDHLVIYLGVLHWSRNLRL